MKNKAFLFIGFLVMIGIQWFIPGQMIVEQVDVRKNGTEFRFESVLVDPNDPFRGKYVTLRYDQVELAIGGDTNFRSMDFINFGDFKTAYVVFGENEKGYAEPIEAYLEEPSHTSDYLQLSVYNYGFNASDSTSTILRMSYPFDRFYMEESKAPTAESLYWESLRLDTVETYSVVHIKEGNWSLSDVRIDDVSIVELATNPKEK